MRTDLIRTRCLYRLFWCLLVMGGFLLAIDPARAEVAKSEPPLKVTGAVWELPLKLPILITIDNLEKWAAQHPCDTSKFVLCFNGIPLKGMPPPFRAENTLGFDLKITPDFRETWKTFVGRAISRDTRVFFTVRNDNATIEGSASAPVPVNWRGLKIFLVVVVAALLVFVWLAWWSDIIREAGEQPKGTSESGAANRKRYSLARTQMACWFFVVVISYVYIWIMTDDLSSLTTSVLALIGISAATGISSALVDSSKRTDRENVHRKLEEKKKTEQVEVEKLRSEASLLDVAFQASRGLTHEPQVHSDLVARQSDLAAKEKEIAQTTRKLREVQDSLAPIPSEGFLNDVLSDEGGVSFHRFQMFAWTIVLVIIFVSKVWDGLVMPDFDPTLLGLMGISGGTYIGFKLPNQQG